MSSSSSDTPGASSRGRPQMLLIAAVFLGPLLAAAWMYYGESFVPVHTTNSGALLQPIVNLPAELPTSPVHAQSAGQWLMLYVNEGNCGDACELELIRLRQMRLMLGKEMDRVGRVFLHGDFLHADGAPDTVLDGERRAGLKTMTDIGLASLLERKRPESLLPGGVYLIDPLGNLVMYFPPDLDPKDVVRDIKHLLKLSNIG